LADDNDKGADCQDRWDKAEKGGISRNSKRLRPEKARRTRLGRLRRSDWKQRGCGGE